MLREENKNHAKKRSLWGRVRQTYGRATLSVCRLLCTGGGSMTVQGCTDILEYGRTCIRLSVCDPDVSGVAICGRDLVCLSYQPDAVRIEGEIRTIRFCRCGEEEQV